MAREEFTATGVESSGGIGARLLAFASEQLMQARRHLAQDGEGRHTGIHEARKCIRRTRAALALGAVKPNQRERHLDEELGRICRGLSPLRDAQALIEALRRLEDAAPSEVRRIVPSACRVAEKQRDQMLRRALQRDPQFVSRLRRLLATQQRMLGLQWHRVDDDVVRHAASESKRRARKAQRRVRRHPKQDEAWHALRRRLRRLIQQDALLADVQPDLRPKLKRHGQLAKSLGESRDDALLLSHSGSRSPFSSKQRELLRRIARERLDQRSCKPGKAKVPAER